MSENSQPPANLAGVADAIKADKSLTQRDRRELASAIATLARCCGKAPADIDANPTAVRALLKTASPKAAGVSQAHFKNTLSRFRRALRHVGIATDRRRNMPLTPDWQALLDAVDPKLRNDLRKIAGFASARGIAPDEMNTKVHQSFLEYLLDQSIDRAPVERAHRARRAWNEGVAARWPRFQKIDDPHAALSRRVPLSAYPEGLGADLDRFRREAAETDLMDEDRRVLSLATVRNYLDNIHGYASALVADGVPIACLSSIEALIAPELVKRGLGRIQRDVIAARRAAQTSPRTRRVPESLISSPIDEATPLPIVIATLSALIGLARHAKVPPAKFEALKAIAKRLMKIAKKARSGMTPKNKARLNQFADPVMKAKFLNLPVTVFARYADVAKPTHKQAREIQDATALAVLLALPVRIGNLVGLDFDKHLHRPACCGPGPWGVSIPGHEVKNGEPIDAELLEPTSAMLRRYCDVFRPLLCQKASTILFVSRTGNAKTEVATARQLSAFIRRETGLLVNPHLIRHFTATNWLAEHPGDYETARELLGHRSTKTTRMFYAHTDKRQSFRRLQELQQQQRAQQPGAKLAFAFGRRRGGKS